MMVVLQDGAGPARKAPRPEAEAEGAWRRRLIDAAELRRLKPGAVLVDDCHRLAAGEALVQRAA